MLVARVVSPVSWRESWTVLGDDDAPVGPIERYLAYLTDIERSPNTFKAYAHDLKDWFVFLADRGLDWRRVRLEDVGEFVAWLRLPLPARDRRVAVLPSVAHHCAESTVNRKLSALGMFYTHAARDASRHAAPACPGARHGDAAVRTRVIRFLAKESVTSLLDNDDDTWRVLGRTAFNDSLSRSFLGYAYRQVADLAEAGGWEAEYPRDVWHMRRLGFDSDRTLRFTGIPQPWLREPAKRWVRWRPSTGLGLEAGGGRPVVAITRFARFLAEIGIDRIDQVDRPVLERYLADLSGDSASAQRRGTHIGLLNRFFAAIRQHRWDTTLPPDAMFFTEDYPKREERLPRALAEQAMAQLEHPGNLAKFDDPAYRLITMILMRCGLRITDALRLRADCLVSDADGAPYLRYVNHKMKRDALVPIDEQLCDLIAEHRQHTAERWPAGHRC